MIMRLENLKLQAIVEQSRYLSYESILKILLAAAKVSANHRFRVAVVDTEKDGASPYAAINHLDMLELEPSFSLSVLFKPYSRLNVPGTTA